MNNLKKSAVAVALICCATAGSSFAQEAYNPSWYVAPSANVFDPDGKFGVDKNGRGGGIRLGKPISQYWDLQMGTTYANTSNDNGNYRQQTLGVDALYLFSRDTVRPFVLLGAGIERDRAQLQTGTTRRSSPYISGGAGVQLSLGEQWSLQADYRRVYGFVNSNSFPIDRSNANYLTVGFNYAFDKPAQRMRMTERTPEPTPRVIEAPPPPAPPPSLPAATPAAPPPAPPVVTPQFEKFTLSATELFAFDSANLRMPQPKLDEFADALRANADIKNVAITGYADRLGSNSYNLKLSERRAISVRNYLTSKGIDSSRLNVSGKGEANPLVSCTQKNRADLITCLEPNRRVEVEQITVERRVR